MEMDMDSIFREYGMDGIEAQLGELFPTLQIDLETLLKQAFTGDIKGALTGVVQMTFIRVARYPPSSDQISCTIRYLSSMEVKKRRV